MWRRVVTLSLGLLLLPGVAYAQTWSPGAGAQGESTVIGYIDYPKQDFVVEQGEHLTIYGWVVDTAAASGTGIDDVQVYRDVAVEPYLGRATFGVERPDVAEHFGRPDWRYSGFYLTIDTSRLPTGTQTLVVHAHTPSRGWWTRSVAISVVAGEESASTAESDVETISIKSRHGHTLQVEPSLEEAVKKLAETIWGQWALDIAADKGLHVLWSNDLGDKFSQYQYGSRVILLNDAYRRADARALATALAHELQHAVDDTYGWVAWRAMTCQDVEARALLAQSATWNAFYGPFGKAQVANRLEEAHNVVQSQVTNRPATWLDDAMRSYHVSCS